MERRASSLLFMGMVLIVAWLAGAHDASSEDAGGTRHVVSLPMYEVSPVLKRADDVFWSRLQVRFREEGIEAPVALDRGEADLVAHWKARNLLLSQTCGFPYLHVLHDEGVRIVGTPVYAANDDLPAGEYRSVLVVRANAPYKTIADLRGQRAGVNEWNSNSGMNAFRAAVARAFTPEELKKGIFASVRLTGGHLKSVRMIVEGSIDVSAIDSVSYALIVREYPTLGKRTRILAVTPTAPGLPLITSATTSEETIGKMRRIIRETILHPGGDAELRHALKTMALKDFVVISEKEYLARIDALEELARDKGYPELK